jgi:hypothetical protein
MRFLTLNTWGMRGDWTARLPVLRERFAALGPDIVTLQETILTDRADQAADMLGPGYHLAQQRDREADGQGITTASRWPFGRTFEIDLRLTERTRDFACTCLVTEVLAPQPPGPSGSPTTPPTISSTTNGNAACRALRRRAGWNRWPPNHPGT